ncbi:hypothetical protein Trydic_g13151 [Trypoxylus dichotomus]
MGVRVGILGVSRDDYDPILMHKEKKSKVHYKRQRKLTCFKLLPKVCREVIEVPQTFPTTPCKYQETGQTKLARITQCKMWWKYIKAILEGGEYRQFFLSSIAKPGCQIFRGPSFLKMTDNTLQSLNDFEEYQHWYLVLIKP